MMKRLQILLVILLFLHSKIGVALNAHYCGNHIADISWAFDVKGCGMEKSNLSLDFLEKIAKTNCCEDDLIVEQNTSDQTLECTCDRQVASCSRKFPCYVRHCLGVDRLEAPIGKKDR